MKILEDENRRLKQLVADLALDKEVFRAAKKALKPARKREVVGLPMPESPSLRALSQFSNSLFPYKQPVPESCSRSGILEETYPGHC